MKTDVQCSASRELCVRALTCGCSDAKAAAFGDNAGIPTKKKKKNIHHDAGHRSLHRRLVREAAPSHGAGGGWRVGGSGSKCLCC